MRFQLQSNKFSSSSVPNYDCLIDTWLTGDHKKNILLKESPWDVELHLAAARGDAKRLRVLLDSGRVHVDCKDKDGTTPLILAAAGGHIEAVTELLQQGADPNARRLTGTTALFFAAQGGYMDIASLLLEHGSIVDSCSIDGGTPLFVACQCGHLDVVEGLIERGANPNAYMKDGATALFIAAQNGHLRILEVLLEHGAKTDAARTDGATPLWIGAQMGHDHVVRRLLKAGAKVDATRHDGATPLFKAAHKGHTAVVGELLKYRPSLGILPNGESALHAAALTGQMTVTRQLVGAGADPLLVNQEGITPLQLAIRHSQTQVANYLKDKVRTRTGTS
ncbi:ankyrin repeat domain-containing protein 29 isoform X1 [Bombus impatiens]|uniref:Ankyrin repeat domain-containing protein 29 isoform X1 n=1 Tax=Bombus impatiens TaxID=132113 RepID=A0A6P6FCG8_BOMIM|nr:ankyrin repeat domain-containing protein 29 isoform X1 [Bombus impatiens]